MKTEVQGIYCRRCGHSWYPRSPEVRTCPKCKSVYWDRERKYPNETMARENNPQWRGDDVGYASLHLWVASRKPKPKLCGHCGAKKPHDLASINHTYTRNLDEWVWLCRSCHMKSDIANGLRDATIVNAKRVRGENGRYIKTNLSNL